MSDSESCLGGRKMTSLKRDANTLSGTKQLKLKTPKGGGQMFKKGAISKWLGGLSVVCAMVVMCAPQVRAQKCDSGPGPAVINDVILSPEVAQAAGSDVTIAVLALDNDGCVSDLEYRYAYVGPFGSRYDMEDNQPPQYNMEDYVVTGDGSTYTFSGSLELIDGAEVAPETVSISDGVENFTDNGEGVLVGNAGGTGAINYETGAFVLNFAVAPVDGVDVRAMYEVDVVWQVLTDDNGNDWRTEDSVIWGATAGGFYNLRVQVRDNSGAGVDDTRYFSEGWDWTPPNEILYERTCTDGDSDPDPAEFVGDEVTATPEDTQSQYNNVVITAEAVDRDGCDDNLEYRFSVQVPKDTPVPVTTGFGQPIGIGDGSVRLFTGTLRYHPVVAASTTNPITFSSPEMQDITDVDGDGIMEGGDPVTPSTINYDTGEFNITFFNPPLDQQTVFASYATGPVEEMDEAADGDRTSFSKTLTYRPIAAGSVTVQDTGTAVSGELIDTGVGTRTFSDTLASPPVPGTLELYVDGVLLVTDVGCGVLGGAGSGTVNYYTGAVSVIFDDAPLWSSGNNITANYDPAQAYTGEILGVGNDIQTTFSAPPFLINAPINPGSLTITDTVETFANQPNPLCFANALIGDQGGDGVHNPATGFYGVNFNSAPADGQSITASYSVLAGSPITSEVIGQGTGIIHYTGTLDEVPVQPQLFGVVVTAGGQTVTANFPGIFGGDGDGVIDYNTGIYSIDFDTAPLVGEAITADYTRRIQELNDDGEGNLIGADGSGSVIYSTGVVSATFVSAPFAGAMVTINYEVDENPISPCTSVGTGDGKTNFTGDNLNNTPVDPDTVIITDGEQEVRDASPAYSGTLSNTPVDLNSITFTDDSGTSVGEPDQVVVGDDWVLVEDGSGWINYADGTYSVTFDDWFAAIGTITIEYDSNGITFVETVPTTGLGALVGDVDPMGTNTINYTTGAINLTLYEAPPTGAAISVDYSDSEDTPHVEEPFDGAPVGTTYYSGYATDNPAMLPVGANTVVINDPVVSATEQIATGTGSVSFSGTLLDSGIGSITKTTLVIRIALLPVLQDNGLGSFISLVPPGGRGSIDYDTGAYNITFNSAPPRGLSITAEYDRDMVRGPLWPGMPDGSEQIEIFPGGLPPYNYTGSLRVTPVDPYLLPNSLEIWNDQCLHLTDTNEDGILAGPGSGFINYDNGVYDFTLNLPPCPGATTGDPIYAVYAPASVAGQPIGEGTGNNNAQFIGNLGNGLNLQNSVPIKPGSLSITDGTQNIFDVPGVYPWGTLVGDTSVIGDHSINYRTGAYSFRFASEPALGSTITATYDGRGQEVRDDGDGELYAPGFDGTFGAPVGTGDDLNVGVIDYETGFYEVDFLTPPPDGAALTLCYTPVNEHIIEGCDWQASDTCTWTPDPDLFPPNAGYTIIVDVRDDHWTGAEPYIDDTATAAAYQVCTQSGPLPVEFNADPEPEATDAVAFPDNVSPQTVGVDVVIQAVGIPSVVTDPDGNPCADDLIEYRFAVRGPNDSDWRVIVDTDTTTGDWTLSNGLTWETVTEVAGVYSVRIDVRDTNSVNNGTDPFVDDYDDHDVEDYTLFCAVYPDGRVMVDDVTFDPVSAQVDRDTQVTITAIATDPDGCREEPIQYRFRYSQPGFDSPQLIQDWSTDDTAIWNVNDLASGTYTVVVEVRDEDTVTFDEDAIDNDIEPEDGVGDDTYEYNLYFCDINPTGGDDSYISGEDDATLESVTLSPRDVAVLGETVVIDAVGHDPDGCASDLQYKVWVAYSGGGGSWTVVQEWLRQNADGQPGYFSIGWDTEGLAGGDYQIRVEIRDNNGIARDDFMTLNYRLDCEGPSDELQSGLIPPNFIEDETTMSPKSVLEGATNPVTVEASANDPDGCNVDLEYKYLIWKAGEDGDFVVLQDWANNDTLVLDPTTGAGADFFGGTYLAGSYIIEVRVRDDNQTDIDDTLQLPLVVKTEADVCDGCGFDTIQAAIEAADDDDIILVGDGTYVENINIDKRIVLQSVNGPEFTIINGNGSGTTVDIDDDATGLIIEGFGITGGVSTNDGGGVHIAGAEKVLLINCWVYSNRAEHDGGGVYMTDDDDDDIVVEIKNSIIRNNIAGHDGGGVHAESEGYDIDLLILNTTVSGNTALRNGGGVSAEDDEDVTVEIIDSWIISNKADHVADTSDQDFPGEDDNGGLGGGIYADGSDVEVTLEGTIIRSNSADSNHPDGGQGGGIYADYRSEVTIIGGSITGNRAINGGAISGDRGDVNIIDNADSANAVLISGNTARNDGGAIYARDDLDVNIIGATFQGNAAASDGSGIGGGGAIYIQGTDSRVNVNRVTFEGNTATNGGAVYLDVTECDGGNIPTFNNCLFTDNDATVNGGAFYANLRIPRVVHCTFANNTAASAGGAFYFHQAVAANCEGSAAGIFNSILWDNAPDQIAADANSVLDASVVVRYTDVQGGWFGGMENIDADPLFIGSGDYSLQEGSPCIDTAKLGLSYIDILGNIRPYPVNGNPDMGAYEARYAACGGPIPQTVAISCGGDLYLTAYTDSTLAVVAGDATIYYTTDGSTPGPDNIGDAKPFTEGSGTLYAEDLEGVQVVKYYASVYCGDELVKEYWVGTDDAAALRSYASPIGGTYCGPQAITLTANNPEATIYWVLEGDCGEEGCTPPDISSVSEVIGIGDGVWSDDGEEYAGTTDFGGDLDHNNIVPRTLRITGGTETFFDLAGTGALIGSDNGKGTINYITGAYNIMFDEAPADGSEIVATYQAGAGEWNRYDGSPIPMYSNSTDNVLHFYSVWSNRYGSCGFNEHVNVETYYFECITPTISGRVQEQDTSPAVGARVVVYDLNADTYVETYTNAIGGYVVTGLMDFHEYNVVVDMGGSEVYLVSRVFLDDADVSSTGVNQPEVTQDITLINAPVQFEVVVESTQINTITIRFWPDVAPNIAPLVSMGEGAFGSLSAISGDSDTGYLVTYTRDAGDTAVQVSITENPASLRVAGNSASATIDIPIDAELYQIYQGSVSNAAGGWVGMLEDVGAEVFFPPYVMDIEPWASDTARHAFNIVRYDGARHGDNPVTDVFDLTFDSAADDIVRDGILTGSTMEATLSVSGGYLSVIPRHWDEAAGAWSGSGISNVAVDGEYGTVTFDTSHLTDFAGFIKSGGDHGGGGCSVAAGAGNMSSASALVNTLLLLLPLLILGVIRRRLSLTREGNN